MRQKAAFLSGGSVMPIRLRLLIGWLALPLAAYANNPYHDFYKQVDPRVAPDARKMPGVILQNGPIQILKTGDMAVAFREAVRHGYVAFGQSIFNSGGKIVPDEDLLKQAQAVGAQMVIVTNQYWVVFDGTAPPPLQLPTLTRTADRDLVYEYGAVYFVRRKPRLGVVTKPLDVVQRQKYQSNSMLAVDDVIDGSPAFKADILPGDILASVNGQPPFLETVLDKRLSDLEGQEVDIELIRGDQHVQKRVRLDSYQVTSLTQGESNESLAKQQIADLAKQQIADLEAEVEQQKQRIAELNTQLSTRLQSTEGFTGLKPVLRAPSSGSLLPYYPRNLDLDWEKVPGAVVYQVETEILISHRGDESFDWTSLEWRPLSKEYVDAVDANHYSIFFNGANWGRWRVLAIDKNGNRTQTSDWWLFRFTK